MAVVAGVCLDHVNEDPADTGRILDRPRWAELVDSAVLQSARGNESFGQRAHRSWDGGQGRLENDAALLTWGFAQRPRQDSNLRPTD